MIVIILLTVVSVLYFVYFNVRRRRVVSMVNKFEGPHSLPIVGNALMFLGSSMVYEDDVWSAWSINSRGPSPYLLWVTHLCSSDLRWQHEMCWFYLGRFQQWPPAQLQISTQTLCHLFVQKCVASPIGSAQLPPFPQLFINYFDETLISDIYHFGLNLVRTFKGRPFKVWLFQKPYIVVHDPEDIRLVSNTLHKSKVYKFLTELLGDGLVTAEPEKWKRHRRLMNPIFNTTILSSYFNSTFNKHVHELVKILETKANTGKAVDVWPQLVQTSTNFIYDSVMSNGEDMSKKEGFSEFRENFEKASWMIVNRLYRPWLYPRIFFEAFLYINGCSDVFRKSHDFHIKTLQERRKEFEGYPKSHNGQRKEAKCMVDILLNMRDNDYLTDKEVTDEIITTVFAASENISIIEGFTFLMLAIRQDIQDEVYKELVEIFGDSNRLPTIDDLAKLVFLEQCLKESLRVFSILPTIARHATKDIPLRNDLVIPAGVDFVILLIGVHHNSDIYPDPETWNPHNFDPEKVATRPLHSFIPFGIGQRTCLGYKYGMLAMKTVLSTILRNFRLSTFEKKVNLKIEFKIRSANGCPIVLDYRHGGSIF